MLMPMTRLVSETKMNCFHLLCKRDRVDEECPPSILKECITLVFIGVVILVATGAYSAIIYKEISFNEFTNSYLTGNVDKLEVVNKEWVRVLLFPEHQIGYKTHWFSIGSVDTFERNLQNAQLERKIENFNFVPVVYKSEVFASCGASTLLVCFFVWILFETMWRICYLMGEGLKDAFGFGRKPFKIIKPSKIGVKFSDVIGCEEAKNQIMELVTYLKHPQKYIDLDAEIPKGAILIGPPGTGKTLLAKATAVAANVPIIIVSGSQVVEKFSLVGPSKIKDIFSMARKIAPCIVFLDEFDAIGVRTCSRKCNNPPKYMLNQVLDEMAGFNKATKVVVLAASKRSDILEQAALRPNRFNPQIFVPPPDIKERESIFKIQLQPLRTLVDKSDLEQKMAALTPGFTGGDIVNVCNKAALIAAGDLNDNIQMNHFEQAVEKVIADMEKTAPFLNPQEKRIAAFHEAGHAVAGWFLEHQEPLLEVSIVPSKICSGYTMFRHPEHYKYTKEQLFDRMCSDLGGRVAVQIFFGETTTLDVSDLKKVTYSAYTQVLKFGLSEKLGHLSFDVPAFCTDPAVNRLYSEATAQVIDSEVRELVSQAYDRTLNLLTEQRENVEKVALRLLDKYILRKNDIVELLGPRPFEERAADEDVNETGHVEEDAALPREVQE